MKNVVVSLLSKNKSRPNQTQLEASDRQTQLRVHLHTGYTPSHVLGSRKHREQNDGPKSSIESIFYGCPIPSDLVIVNVPAVQTNMPRCHAANSLRVN